MPPTPIPMPARGAHTAPKFDSTKPEELRRYFADVEYLMGLANIVTTEDKKKACSRYLSVQDQELVEGLDEFKDATKTYDEFKKAALSHYAGNDEEHLYTLKDWDAHLGSTARVGIHSENELAAFFRTFVCIAKFLISKKRLSETEQSHAFLRALQPASLQAAVKQRLQIIRPNVHADDPYALADLYDAAKFCLAGSPSLLLNSVPTPSPAEPVVKTDPELKAVLTSISQLVAVLASQARTNAAPSQSPQTPSNANPSANPGRSSGQRHPGCSYCLDLTHFMRECQKLIEDIKAGLVRRNEENKLVLPDGRYPSRALAGQCHRERILAWHEQNPGQKLTPQLIVDVVKKPATPTPVPAVDSFVLSDEQRLEAIAVEQQMLRTRMAARKEAEARKKGAEAKETPDSAEISDHRPKADQRSAPAATSNPDSPPTPTSSSHEAPAPAHDHATADAPAAPDLTPPPGPFPEHPYAAARDAAYAPPKERNLGAPHKPPVRPPIHDPRNAQDVFNAVLDADVTVKARKLLASPEVSALARQSFTPRRPADKPAEQLFNSEDALPALTGFDFDPTNDHAAARAAAIRDSLPDAVSTAAATHNANGIFVPDAFVALYDQGRLPEGLITSAENHRHTLHPPHRRQPRMQSANGAITPSLGVARNVAFTLRDIVLYLQVHIVRNPAYDVLLGRPFDVLTQSVVHNYSNNDQTITIRDPNTGRTATVPTIPRGSSRVTKEGFLKLKSSRMKH
ncbi:hypothetical protein MIND_00577300 [Mycena indigotica]|uniref:Uncharacterized protein n=1 Tax=Mycena indigotica TaxID=2126181 RepID=A0A8H6W6J5_9AGAR|nr:uncharacterized protein MIND_00577300 [Mycena indigotica]KAF7303483.1 hypothetical protein MIND_00577300 [Mycena indigotica]